MIPGVQGKIVESAMRLFSSTGYSAVDMRSVAKDAGVAVGTVYNYYPDKASLFLGVVEARHGAFQEALAEGLAVVPPGPERVVYIGVSLYAFVRSHLGLWESVRAGHDGTTVLGSAHHSRIVQASTEELATHLLEASRAQLTEAHHDGAWFLRAASALTATVAALARQQAVEPDADLSFIRDMVYCLMGLHDFGRGANQCLR